MMWISMLFDATFIYNKIEFVTKLFKYFAVTKLY